jgi:hypothetical protein
MKKKFLTMMLFFAFLFAGFQNASAQDGLVVNANYVSPIEATSLLASEIQTIEANPIFAQMEVDNALFPHLERKLNFYVSVSEQIQVGITIPTSITEGAIIANNILDSSGETFDPYLQGIVTLLSQ